MRTIAFHVASVELALPVAQLREIVEPPPVTRVPGAPAALRGVTNLRGQVVPVLDVAVRLGLGAPAPGARPCLLVTDPASCGGVACALAVDGVRGVEDVDLGDARPPPTLLAAADWLEAIVVRGDRLTLLVDLERLLDVTAIEASRPLPASDVAALRADASAQPRDAAAATGAAEREHRCEAWAPSATPERNPVPAAARGGLDGAGARRHEPSRAAARPTSTALPRPSGAATSGAARRVAPGAVGDARDLVAGVVHRAADAGPAAGTWSPAPSPRTGDPAREAPAAPASPRAGPSRGRRVPLVAVAAAALVLLFLFALARRSGDEGRGVEGGAPPSAVAPPRFAAAPVREAPPPPPPRLEPGRLEAPALASASIEVPVPVAAEPPRAAAALGPRVKLPPLRPGDVYEVVPGDTLWSISARMLFDPHRWPRLYDANRRQVVDPDLIRPGQRFVVPDPASR